MGRRQRRRQRQLRQRPQERAIGARAEEKARDTEAKAKGMEAISQRQGQRCVWARPHGLMGRRRRSDDDHGQWDNGQIRSLQPVYSLSLAMIQQPPIAISDRFSAIAESSQTSIDVPLDNLVVAKPRKLRLNRANLCTRHGRRGKRSRTTRTS